MRWRTGAIALAAAMAIGLSGCAPDPADSLEDPEQLAQLEQLRGVVSVAVDDRAEGAVERVLVVGCEAAGQARIRYRLSYAAEGDGRSELAAVQDSLAEQGVVLLDDGALLGYDSFLIDVDRPEGIESARLGLVNGESGGTTAGSGEEAPDLSVLPEGGRAIEVRLAGPCVGQPAPVDDEAAGFLVVLGFWLQGVFGG